MAISLSEKVVSSSEKILVACCGDWHTHLIATSLLLLGKRISLATTFPMFKIPGPLINITTFVSWSPLFKGIMAALSYRRPYYANFGNVIAFQLFDKKISTLMSREHPSACFLWSTMCSKSLLVAKDLGIPSIVVLGNSPLTVFKGREREASELSLTIWQRWIDIQKLEFALADTILVESNYVREALVSIDISPEKVRVIPPHVKIPTLGKNKYGPLKFGTVQLSRRKGNHLLLALWKYMGKDAPLLKLIGSCNFKRDFGYDKLPDEVYSTGFLDKQKYEKELQELDVALFPTFEDGGPRALFECMSYGACPIVSERSAGPDHIRNGVNGFILPVGDRGAWRKKIEWCISNPEAVREIGSRAREYVKNNLDLDRYPIKIESLLLDLCKK